MNHKRVCEQHNTPYGDYIDADELNADCWRRHSRSTTMSDYLHKLKAMDKGCVYTLSDTREMARESAKEIETLRERVRELEADDYTLMAVRHAVERAEAAETKLADIADKVELARDTLDTVPLCDGCMQEDSDPCGCWIGELQAILNKP